MAFDDAYAALTDGPDDARWAYGTGFTDPMAGVDTAVPAGVDRQRLSLYCQMLGDDALVLSHRLQQWVTRAPELEDELAVANLALDLLGQARLLLTRAGQVEGAGRDEDTFAYTRSPEQFRNVRFVEPADGDFARLVLRLFLFSAWRLALFDRLSGTRDPVLSAVAAKGVPELTYHRDYAAQWVVRLGDGTAESHERMRAAVTAVLPGLPELFRAHPVERDLAAADVAVDPATCRADVLAVVTEVLDAATLPAPDIPGLTGMPDGADLPGGSGDESLGPSGGADHAGGSGRDGGHGPELTDILTELQSVARSVPGGRW